MPELTERLKSGAPSAGRQDALAAANELRRTGGVRYPLVDSLRAIAALFVFTFHVAGVASPPHWLSIFTYRLNLGVTLFFVISGFLLYRPFVAARLIPGRRALGTGRYAWHRFLRIVPAYFVALTLVALWWGNHSVLGPDAIVYYGFGQVYAFRSILGGIGQAWTLSIEVAFYVFLPFWAWLIARIPARTARRRLRVELVGLGVLAAASLIYKPLIHGDTSMEPHLWFGLDNALPVYLDQFAIGMALAVASVWCETHRAPDAVKVIDNHPWLPWGVAAIALTVLATQFGTRTAEFGTLEVHYLDAIVALGLILPAVFGRPGRGFVRRLLANRVLIWIGVVSYGLYLWHVVVIEQIARWHIPQDLGISTGTEGLCVWAVVCLIPALAFAAASWYGIERPALRHKSMAPPGWLRRITQLGRRDWANPARLGALSAGAVLAMIVWTNAINPPAGLSAPLVAQPAAPSVSGRGWVYVVATYDGQTLRMYQDARLIASAHVSGRPGPASAPIEVGNYLGGAKWAGPLKYVAVYRSALNVQQIQSHYLAGLAGWTAFDVALQKNPAPAYLWRNRLPAPGLPHGADPPVSDHYSLEAWLLATRTDKRVVVYQPRAWFLQTDVLGRWRAGVFVGGREFDATSQVVPPRAALG